MHKLQKLGFLTNLSFIFLLPLFFIPTVFVPLGLAKVILIVLASVIVLVALLAKVVKEKTIVLPKSLLLWGVLVLPLVYVISGFLSNTPILSLFGYALEPGTATSIVLSSVLLFSTAYYFRDLHGLVRAQTALFVSLGVVALFVLVKIISQGSWLTMSTFFGNTGNPVGAWTDLATIFGFLAVMTIFASEMLPLTKKMNWLVRGAYVLSLILLVVVNFSSVWLLLLASSIILLVYFATIERREGISLTKRSGVRMAIILLAISLVFVWNPSIGSKDIATRVADSSKVVNSYVRPNLTSTLLVGRATLSESLLLGSGPNTFDKDWLLYKSEDTNATPFWNVAFPFGFGFIPTTMISTGLLGIVAWILFFALFLILGIKALSKNQENRSDRFVLISTFLTSLYLWVACIIYSPSLVIIVLAFLSTGLFLGATEATGVVSRSEIFINRNKLTLFGSYLFIILITAGIVTTSFVSIKKVNAALHFQKALVYSNTQGKTLDEIEGELGRAITISPADPFWSAVSQVELTRANNALNSTTGSNSENQTTFQNAISASIGALQNAISLNYSYNNWIALGNMYESLVPEPFAVEGAYESAQTAYKSAEALHPLSPEVPLLMAKLEFDNKNVDGAREFVAEALKRKADYADAYFFLSQLEVSENNLRQAIESAETGALLSPGNPGVFFQLGLLKYSNRDYNGAVTALSQAIALVPDYANAKYYLGISLDRLGKKSEAIKQFEDLNRTNPNNSAITSVLENLQAGRAALSGAPVADTSEESLPIKGQ